MTDLSMARQRERGFYTLEEAVRRLTSAPAAATAIHHRGALKAGMRADINLIDLARVGELLPEMVQVRITYSCQLSVIHRAGPSCGPTFHFPALMRIFTQFSGPAGRPGERSALRRTCPRRAGG
jgi:hypothetical protein